MFNTFLTANLEWQRIMVQGSNMYVYTHTHTHTQTCITESPCCTLETNTTLTKLQFLKKGKEIKRINQSQCSEEGKKRLNVAFYLNYY